MFKRKYTLVNMNCHHILPAADCSDICYDTVKNDCKLLLTVFFIIKPTRCTDFTNLFWHETLHVLDGSSVRHQELICCTLSNGICHTGM